MSEKEHDKESSLVNDSSDVDAALTNKPKALQLDQLIARTDVIREEKNRLERLNESELTFTERSILEHLKHELHLLDKLLAPNKSEAQLAECIERYLVNHWEHVTHSHLSYTAMPDHPLTLFCCDMANLLGDYHAAPPLQYLMPGVSVNSRTPDSYPDLKGSTRGIVSHHIQSERGDYLIPLAQLTEMMTSTNDKLENLKFTNHYYDASLHTPDRVNLTENEIMRLTRTSAKARALYDAKITYDEIAFSDTNLLEQLRVLVFNLCSSESGETPESKAHLAIKKFLEGFYDKLDEDSLKAIPSDVTIELEKLRYFTKTQGPIASIELFTCIPNNALIAAIQGKQMELATIPIVKIKPEKETINRALKDIDIASFKYNRHLQRDQSNCDALGINAHYMDINVDKINRFSSFEEFTEQFVGLTPPRITWLLNDRKYAKYITEMIGNIDNLCFITGTQLSADQIEALLQRAGNHLRDSFLDARNLASMLTILNNKKSHAVLRGLKDNLHTIINSPNDFIGVLKSLADEEQVFFLSLLSEKTVDKITMSLTDLMHILRSLTETELSIFLNDTMSSKIINHIPLNELGILLAHYNEAQTKMLLDALKDNFPENYFGGHDLSNVFKRIGDAKATILIEAIKDRLPENSSILHGAETYALTLNELNEHNKNLMNAAMFDHFTNMIKCGSDFACISSVLNEEDRSSLLITIQNRLSNIITDCEDFSDVLSNLNEHQRAVVFDAIKDKLPNMITDAKSFNRVLKYLSAEQRTIIFEALGNTFGDITRHRDDPGDILEHLNKSQRELFFNDIKNMLPKLITCTAYFNNTLKYLNDEQRLAAFNICEPSLKTQIDTGEGLADVLEYINDAQRAHTIQNFKNRLGNLDWDRKSFMRTVKLLNQTQRTLLIHAVKRDLPDFLNNIETFNDLFDLLNESQKEIAFDDFVLKKLLKYIKNGSDLGPAALNLTNTQLNDVVRKLDWSKISNLSNEDFIPLLKCLTPQDCVTTITNINMMVPGKIHLELIREHVPKASGDNLAKISQNILALQLETKINSQPKTSSRKLPGFFSNSHQAETRMLVKLKAFIESPDQALLSEKSLIKLKKCKYPSINRDLLEPWLAQGLLQEALGLDKSIKTVDQLVKAVDSRPASKPLTFPRNPSRG